MESLFELEKDLLELIKLEGNSGSGADGSGSGCPCQHDGGMTDCVTAFVLNVP